MFEQKKLSDGVTPLPWYVVPSVRIPGLADVRSVNGKDIVASGVSLEDAVFITLATRRVFDKNDKKMTINYSKDSGLLHRTTAKDLNNTI